MHNWWPDTWEKLPASAPPPSPRRRRTLRRRGLPTSGGCAQLHLRKNQLLSAQLRNLHSFQHCLDQTGHLSLHNDGHGNHPKLRTPQFSALSGPCTCQAQQRACRQPPRTAPVEYDTSCTVCTVRTCLGGITGMSNTQTMNRI